MHYPKTSVPIIIDELENCIFREFEEIKIPDKPKAQYNYFILLFGLTIITAVYLLNSNHFLNNSIKSIFAVIALIFSVVLVVINIKFNFQIKIKLTNELKNYRLELERIKTENEIRKRAKLELFESGNEIAYKNSRIIEVLENYSFKRSLSIVLNDKNKKGITEKHFLKCLVTVFGDNIKTDCRFDGNLGFGFDYTPDFLFANEKIAIVIEIDEPYTLINGVSKPIHVRNDKNELARTSFFLNNNYCVIRFAEIQIISQPWACCYHIAEFISTTIKDSEYVRKIQKILPATKNDLKKVERWSQESALQLLKEKFRENLYSEFINSKDTNTLFAISRNFDEKHILLIKIITNKNEFLGITLPDLDTHVLCISDWELSELFLVQESLTPNNISGNYFILSKSNTTLKIFQYEGNKFTLIDKLSA